MINQTNTAHANGLYELILPNGKSEKFASLGEVLHRINRRETLRSEDRLFGKASEIEVWSPAGKLYLVEQSNNHLGIRMSANDGRAQSILNALLNEVMSYARGDKDKIKSPWQMTSSQWGAINAIGSIAYGVIPCLTSEQLQDSCFGRDGESCSVANFFGREFFARFGYGHNGPVYDGFQTNSRHEIHVAYALARDENVPEEVLAEYMEGGLLGTPDDPHWFDSLLKKPYLRGRISSDKLGMLISLVKFDTGNPFEITVENAPFLIGLMNRLPANTNFVDADNILYENGVLRARPFVSNASPSLVGTPVNAFANEVRTAQVNASMLRKREYIDTELKNERMTFREREYQLKWLEDIPNSEPFNWANKIANAIENKDIHLLLSALDGTLNDTTQRVVEKHFSVKLRNVKAAERRRAIFALVGHVTEQDYQAAEVAFKTALEAKEQAQREEDERKRKATRLQDTRAVAARTNFSVNGKPMNGAEFIDLCFKSGFSRLTTMKKGAITVHVLCNAEDRYYKLKRRDGTIEYAQALLDKAVENA